MGKMPIVVLVHGSLAGLASHLDARAAKQVQGAEVLPDFTGKAGIEGSFSGAHPVFENATVGTRAAGIGEMQAWADIARAGLAH